MTRTAGKIRCLAGLACVLLACDARATSNDAGVQANFTQALAEFDEAQHLLSEQPDQARRLFRSAAQRFGSIIAQGIVNGRLEFNLANCYLQADEVGRAILHYRRAERLIPRDPMLQENLSVARSRCLTTIRSTRGSAFLRNLFFWHYQTSVAGRARAAVGFYLGIWVLLLVRQWSRRRAIGVWAIIFAVLAGTAAGSVAASHWGDRNAPSGVVTGMDVAIYKGPGTGYQRQFEQPLQPGVEFTLRDRTRSGWWKVELPDGKSGWIDAGLAELVPYEGF